MVTAVLHNQDDSIKKQLDGIEQYLSDYMDTETCLAYEFIQRPEINKVYA